MNLKENTAPTGEQYKPGSNVWAHVLATIAVCMWGYSFVSTKVLLENGLGPTQIYICRFIIAYVIVLCISHKRMFSRTKMDEFLFFICGLLSGSLYFIAENNALEYTLATNVALLTSLSPLITMMLVACIYRNEKISIGTWIGAAIAIVGVACVVFNSSNDVQIRPLGDLLSIIAAFSWSVYSLILKKLNAVYDVWFITRKTFFYGLLTAIPFLVLGDAGGVNPFSVMSRPAVWGNLLFLGLGASTISFLIWGNTVKRLGAITANNYMYLQPVITLIVSAIVLKERVNFIGITGIVLIIGGLWLGDYLTRNNFGARN
ncbi:MAG: DMT family transporter [Muribaculaceae bacterium]|nr:DMT family transporter [Muribaculaceae bacterium]